jgi:hypothetical protein
MASLKSLPETFRKQKPIGKVIIILLGLLLLCCLCSVSILIFSPDKETTTMKTGEVVPADQTKSDDQQEGQTEQELVTLTAEPTATPKPTKTPQPTNTPLPPTETPDPNLLVPGTYIVGKDIRAGFYIGTTNGTEFLDSCYWAKLSDLSGEFDSIIANDNSIGQYYIEVLDSDYALETACDLRYLENLPDPVSDFPQKIESGTYLVGIDIQPGTYRGQAGTDISESCYWERLSNARGGFNGIIANDNAAGQFYVQVGSGDFALHTACTLERVDD